MLYALCSSSFNFARLDETSRGQTCAGMHINVPSIATSEKPEHEDDHTQSPAKPDPEHNGPIQNSEALPHLQLRPDQTTSQKNVQPGSHAYLETLKLQHVSELCMIELKSSM